MSKKGAGMNMTEEEKVIHEAFDMFDKDGNGSVSSDEVINVLRALGMNPTVPEVEDFIKRVDLNDSGNLQFEEFKSVFIEFKKEDKNSSKAMEDAFRLFDKDGNGYLDATELKIILTKIGLSITKDELDQMIDVADMDKDGKINYKEFSNFICKN